MENFVLPESTDTLKDSRQLLNNALLTVRSLSAGTSFPTDNVSVGMICYRTDQEKYYQNTGDGTWSAEINLTAKNATSATKDNIGNVINDFYVAKSGDQTITGTKTFTAYPIFADGVRLPAGKEFTWHEGSIGTTQPIGWLSQEKYSGCAASATKLDTAHTINGVSFDGTGDITIVNSIAQGGTGASTAEKARANLGINSVPTGTIIAYAANSAPDGYLLCNGAAVSRTTYATLFGKIGTTYGTGDGSTTFALPNLTDKFLQGSATAGTAKAAGLPNITGTMWDLMSTVATGMGNGSGAFQTRAGVAGDYNSSIDTRHPEDNDGMSFDASRSSPIYGKSTTVQPPALTTRFYIKY